MEPVRRGEFPELSGALAGLKILDAQDLGRHKAAVEAGLQMGWGYYFPNLLAHNRPGRCAMLWTEDNGSMCVFRWQARDKAPRLDLYLPPIPLSVAALRRSLDRANDFNRDRSAQVSRIDAKDAVVMSAIPALRVRQRRVQHLFAPSSYENLDAELYRTVRRRVALFDGRSDVEFAPYSWSHAQGCKELVARWKKAQRDPHTTARASGANRAIELAGTLPPEVLGGEVVLVGGHVAGFALGGEIRPGLACGFDRKCDNGLRGLAHLQFRSFLLSLRGFERVNDGSDAGRAGLRQLTNNFRPIETHAEYRATQRRSA